MVLGPQFMANQPRMENFSNEAAERMRERGYDISRGTHGTTYTPGMSHVVLPGADVGKTIFDTVSHVNRAYYTAHDTNYPHTAEVKGWSWAERAAEKTSITGEPHAVVPNVTVPARPVLHEVQPVGHID